MFAKQNRREEVSPWEIIRIIAPENDHWVWIMLAAITRPMWLTDEWAMRDFRSVWRKQMELVIKAPHKARVRNG